MPSASGITRRLAIIADVASRCDRTLRERPNWPCRAGCDDCCRSLAAVPELTRTEWDVLRAALETLPEPERAAIDRAARDRIARGNERPIACPLLDDARGLCRVYAARPVACRTYGFYADREGVLGCSRIAELADKDPDIVWGNHEAVMRKLAEDGPPQSLLEWLQSPVA